MKGRPPPSANQQRLFAKAVERKAVKAYMLPADQYNAMNLEYARRILAQESVKFPFYLKYARCVIERLKPEEVTW